MNGAAGPTLGDIFGNGGQAGDDLAHVDWDATPLGSPDRWPTTLTTAIRIMLTSRFAMWMAWGPDLTFFCNDAYRRDTLGEKYPWALGRPAREVWEEIWDDIGPRIESVLRTGVATWDDTLMLFLERSGYREETYHTFSYSPLSHEGTPAGMLCVVAEETERALGERRLATLRDLSAGLAAAGTEREVLDAAQAILAEHDRDLPFSAVFLLDEDDGLPRLAASTGGTVGPFGGWPGWPDAPLHRGDEIVVDLDARAARVAPSGAWDRPPAKAVLVPLRTSRDRRTTGVFVAGFNPYRPVDDTATGFARLVAGYIASALSTARAFEEERHRREALEDLDRTKTRFFANVSHEFRTPLTLILGPLQELRCALEKHGDPRLVSDVDIIERNGIRLSKLVNTLLEFSRLQAGRADARFQPVRLDAFTADLAEAFRPAVEQAGLRLDVAVAAPPDAVYVDPDMWEKVVLNLLSNALKFTFDGSISVRLDADATHAHLRVQDTGIGIDPAEQTRVFDRFHRSQSPRARSVEGSGIGLALVSEIVALHGGTVAVESEPDVGSTFRVSVPLGHTHLPPHLVDTTPAAAGVAGVAPFLAETLAWRDGLGPTEPAAEAPDDDDPAPTPLLARGEVLVADDNPDMRAYVERLLAPEFAVRTVASGAEALVALRAAPADLVLSDLMMPELDGFELVRRIRADPDLSEIPVILLTAHAGATEELQGLNLGADDFLVKPFAADDLRGRVAARLAAGSERRQRQAIAELARHLLGARTPADVGAVVHGFARRWLAADHTTLAIGDSVDDGPRTGLVRLIHHPALGGGLDERYHTGSADSVPPIFEPMRTGAPVTIASFEEYADRYPASLEDARASAHAAMLAVPLIRGTGEVNGVLLAAWLAPHRAGEREIRLWEQAAATVTDALERLRVSEREHHLFVAFQEQLLEVDHHTPAAIVAARYQPATDSLLVGGDWYDVITLSDDALGVSIGDAVGKGLPAARVMAQLRSAVGAAATSSDGPAAVLRIVDRYADHLPGALGTTLVFLTVDRDRNVSWASAGHPLPLLVQGGRAAYLHGVPQPPLGVTAPRDVTSVTHVSGPAAVLLYTDGLVERRGEHLDVGFARLQAAVERVADLPVRTMVDAVLAEMRPDGGYRDDVAILAVRIPGHDRHRYVDALTARPLELRAARTRLRDWLDARLDPEQSADVLLAFAEAMGNAVEHGSRDDPRGVVGVELSIVDGALVGAVTDSGRWDADSTASRQDGRGRGFLMMHALMDTVEIDRSPLGTTVTLRRAL